MKKISIAIFLAISLVLGGCAGMSDTEQGAIGAGAGTIVIAIAGHTAWGAVIDTAARVAGGYLYDHHEKAKKEVHDQAYQ
jgi:hypothetical protein